MMSVGKLSRLRAVAILLGAVALLLAFEGCAGQPSTVPAREKVLVLADGAYPNSFDPGESGNPALIWMKQMHDALTWPDAKGDLQPGLATSWRTLDENSWEFKLRQGVKFHNGAPFNAQVVKFNVDWVLDPKRVYARKTRIAAITETRVVDDYTVVFKTKAPSPLLASGLRDILMLEPGYLKENGDDHVFANPIGTGPYQYVEWRKGDRLVVKANPEYWGGRPKVDRVEFRQMPEASTRVAALKAGEVQIIGMVPVDLIPELQSSGDAKVAPVGVAMSLVMTFDLLHEGPVKNQKVREAIDYAIDKQALWKDLYKGYGAVLDGQLNTKGSFGYNTDLKSRPYDPEKARKLLAEAGYPNGLSLEVHVPQGKYLMDKEMGVAISGQLAKVGINVKVDVMEYGLFSEMLREKKLGPMHLIGWYNYGDIDFAAVWYTKGSGREYWENPEYDKLFQAGRSTLDMDKRMDAYRKLSQMMYDQLPSIFLMQLPAIYGVSNRVTGWEPYSSEMINVEKADLVAK